MSHRFLLIGDCAESDPRFTSVVDLLEDIMQSSAPSFVHSVRIADMGLGRNAARIVAIRSLPDAETRAANKSRAQSSESADWILGTSPEVDDSQASGVDQREDLAGNHVNLEVSFAYRGLPSGQSAASKAGNVHLLVDFFMGMRGIYGLKIRKYLQFCVPGVLKRSVI